MMGYQYLLKRKTGFSAAALAAWEQFLESLPSRRRSKDGIYQVFESRAALDSFEQEIVAVTGEEYTEDAEHVQLMPDGITLHIGRHALPRSALRQFLKQFMERWPSRITESTRNNMTIDELCSEITDPDPPG